MVQSLSDGEYPAGRLMSARCQDKGNLLLEAQRDAQTAIEMAQKNNCGEILREAQAYAKNLDGDIPRVVLKLKLGGVGNMVVKVDDVAIDPAKVNDPIPHNP